MQKRFKISDKRDANVSVRMPSEMKDRFDSLAEEAGRRVTDQILLALIDYLDRLDATTDGAKRLKRA